VSNWILVFTKKPDEFKRRIREGRWPIFKHTPHRSLLREGDKVVFYMGGIGGQKFLGTAVISSKLVPEGLDYSVGISKISVWKDPISIRPLIQELSFILRKDKWGIHLQGGVLPIPEKDYRKITSKTEKPDG
jgi:hypothetical protein